MSRYLLLGTGAGSTFTPSDVPETLHWFDANMTGADMTLNVDKVINLGDAALTQLTQGSDGARFVRTTAGDGKIELTCDGVNDEMSLTANITLNPSSFRIWSVFRTAGGSRMVYRMVSGDNLIRFATFAHDIEVTRGGVGSSYDGTGTRPWADGLYHLSEHSFGGTNATHLLDLDGSPHTFTTNPDSGDPGTASVSLPLSFCGFPGFFFLSGASRALVVCSPDPSPANQALIRAKLNADWF